MTGAGTDTKAAALAPAPAARPRRAPRWSLAALGAVAMTTLGIAYAHHRSRAHAAPAAQPPPDLPHVEGKMIAFSAAYAARAGVEFEPVARVSLVPVVQAVGTVAFDSEHVAAAGTRIRGFVTRVLKVEGSHVEKGEPLAEIESTELGRAQAEVAVVAARKKAAERNARREADLLKSSLTTAREEELARAELEEQTAMLLAATHHVSALGGGGARIGTYLVHAPMGGTLVERHVAAGQSVESDLVAFRVADLDHLWIELSVFEQDLGALRIGDAVVVTPSGGEGARLKGTVAYVGEVIDPETRTAAVRVKVDNRARLLRPGQSVVARIRPAALERQVIAVSVDAVSYVDGKPTLFVAEGDAAVSVRAVKLGRTDGERVEIAEGVAIGQRVVRRGVFALKSELFR